MAIKKPKAMLLAALFFLWFAPLIHGQNSGYFLDTSGERPRFIQRISWIGDEFASRYEVIIEREEGGRYRELRREFTTALFVEVSLAPGRYRCHVIPYDYLDRPGEDSRISFEVLTAMIPDLDDLLVEFIYSDDDAAYKMRLSGKGMDPDADIYLRGDNGENVVPSETRVSEDGSEFQLFFDKDQLAPGDYELIVKNPGGLEASKGGITILQLETDLSEEDALSEADAFSEEDEEAAKRKKLYLFMSAGWMPLFPSYYDEETRFPGYKLSPAGAVVRFDMVFPQWGFFRPGLELAASWSAVDPGQGKTQFLAFGLNLLAQKWFRNQERILTFRVGAGYTMFLPGGDGAISFSGLQAVHANMGVSFLCVLTQNLYTEAGLDYTHWLTESPCGCLRPWVGIGWRF